MRRGWWLAGGAAAAVMSAAGYLGLVTAAVPVDLGIGRRQRALGPQRVDIRAPRETVFELLATPYLGRRTRAVADKIQILHAGTDLVLAAHRTPIRGRLAATTVETVRFVRPERVEFRLVRGPVPEVIETFRLVELGTEAGVATSGAGSESAGASAGGKNPGDADAATIDEPITRLEYDGQLGTDLGPVGQAWGQAVARRWEQVVADTFAAVRVEAERRTRAGVRRRA